MTKYNLNETKLIFLELVNIAGLNERNGIIWILYDKKTFYPITKKKMKKTIINNIKMIKSIVNDVLDSEDERNDDENFYAILDRLEIMLDAIKK